MSHQPSVELPIKLAGLFQPHRYKIVHGGRGSAKSWSTARALLILAAHEKKRILCGREFQKSINLTESNYLAHLLPRHDAASLR